MSMTRPLTKNIRNSSLLKKKETGVFTEDEMYEKLDKIFEETYSEEIGV